MLKTVLLVSILLYTVEGFAQKQNYTLSGNVKDENTGESLIGAVISVKQPKGTGTYSNEYGFYSLTLKKAHMM